MSEHLLEKFNALFCSYERTYIKVALFEYRHALWVRSTDPKEKQDELKEEIRLLTELLEKIGY